MSSQQAMTRPAKNAIAPFREAFDMAQKQFQSALPMTVAKYLTPERLTKVALNAIGRTPALLSCNPLSVLRAVMDAAQLGLEAGSPLGHAYLVPYKDTCQLIVGYRGLIELARRSGNIISVEAHVVYKNDRFNAKFGLHPVLEHEPIWDGERGPIKAVYCVAHFVGGGSHTDVMTIADVEAIRQRSQTGSRNIGPWKTDYAEMARKTVVRRASKYWPLSAELADAIDIDTKHGEASDDDVFVYNDQTGEVETEKAEAKPATDKLLDRLQANTLVEAKAEPEVIDAPNGDTDSNPPAPSESLSDVVFAIADADSESKVARIMASKAFKELGPEELEKAKAAAVRRKSDLKRNADLADEPGSNG